ncbi:MAG: hypothetical protein PF689_06945 [Deltaproteobacteria bacterium]|nr:hypothetical protein [Deltaproteobacteria bacterium]
MRKFILILMGGLFLLFGCDDDKSDDTSNNLNNINNANNINNVNNANNTNNINNTNNTNNASGVYQSSVSSWLEGELEVEAFEIPDTEAPVLLRVFSPTVSGNYAVVVFQHGFLMSSGYYSQMLTYLAGHGFVVVAPQMYEAGGLPLGKPSTEEEKNLALEVRTWIIGNLEQHVQGTPDFDYLGYAGHSRGGKVAWMMLKEDSSLADAIAGVDPVDGTGGPLGGEERVIGGPFNFPFPSYVLGTGLGPTGMQACAPDGDNHEQFYEASASPAYHVTATEYGHNDMLDDNLEGCGMECTSCASGPEPLLMRELVQAHLVAFFRGTLQGDSSVFSVLADENSAPVTIETETK